MSEKIESTNGLLDPSLETFMHVKEPSVQVGHGRDVETAEAARADCHQRENQKCDEAYRSNCGGECEFEDNDDCGGNNDNDDDDI